MTRHQDHLDILRLETKRKLFWKKDIIASNLIKSIFNMATEDAQLDWMYDYIVQFLKSPGWRTPIMIFIDENCGLFDNEEENKLEYSEIHTKFKDMIDVLFENLVGELNVHIEEFAKALELGRKTPVHRRIFEQVSACDNFLSFKKLMCKRNREIEEEALRLM